MALAPHVLQVASDTSGSVFPPPVTRALKDWNAVKPVQLGPPHVDPLSLDEAVSVFPHCGQLSFTQSLSVIPTVG